MSTRSIELRFFIGCTTYLKKDRETFSATDLFSHHFEVGGVANKSKGSLMGGVGYWSAYTSPKGSKNQNISPPANLN